MEYTCFLALILIQPQLVTALAIALFTLALDSAYLVIISKILLCLNKESFKNFENHQK